MDILYIGDIPQEYHFANFNNNYIDLYNTDTLRPNTTYTYYRIYLYDNLFEYTQNTTITSSYYTSTVLHDVDVSNNICYRRDFSNICVITFIFVFFAVFLLNLITSIIRKGGVLGGLL